MAAGGGDVDAFGAFYDATAPMVLGVVERVLGRPRTERVVEEIYLVLWRDAPAFDPGVRSADAALLATVRRVLVRPVRAMVTVTRARRPGDGLRSGTGVRRRRAVGGDQGP
ncbi:MAG: hypothetical protein ABW212_11425 [Pseudonocardia sediminis]